MQPKRSNTDRERTIETPRISNQYRKRTRREFKAQRGASDRSEHTTEMSKKRYGTMEISQLVQTGILRMAKSQRHSRCRGIILLNGAAESTNEEKRIF